MIRQVPKNKLWSIFIITLFNEITITIGFPILTFLCFDPNSTLFPTNASDSSRSFWFGLLSSLPHMVAIVTYPILGYASDHWGRKPILILGAASALLLSILTTFGIFYGTISLLLIGSIIAGLCSRTMPITLAVVGDMSEDRYKIVNMGYAQFFISVGAFIGPLLGGYFAKRFFFENLNFSMPYLIGVFMALFTLILVIKSFKESYSTTIANNTKNDKFVWKRLFNSNVIKISLILILTQISWRIYYLFAPPILQKSFHYSTTSVGLFLGLVAVWLAIASIFIKFFSNLSMIKIVKYFCWAELFGLLLFIIGSLFPLGKFSEFLIWGSAIPVAMSDVIIFCALTTLYSQSVSEHDQGKVMGLCFLITSAVWSLVGFMGGIIMPININLPILSTPLWLIIVLILLFSKSMRSK